MRSWQRNVEDHEQWFIYNRNWEGYDQVAIWSEPWVVHHPQIDDQFFETHERALDFVLAEEEDMKDTARMVLEEIAAKAVRLATPRIYWEVAQSIGATMNYLTEDRIEAWAEEMEVEVS